jgi:hypothetical protein
LKNLNIFFNYASRRSNCIPITYHILCITYCLLLFCFLFFCCISSRVGPATAVACGLEIATPSFPTKAVPRGAAAATPPGPASAMAPGWA